MPSHRHRSRSRSPRYRSRSRSPERSSKRRHRDRDRSRERSESPERKLPDGVSPISEKDYFQKSDEFRVWLKEEKRKYFDELSGERARSYFRKFVKAWNRGKLSSKFYSGVGAVPASSNTSYKWGFSSKLTSEEASGGASRRDPSPQPSSSRPSGSRVIGPTLPSSSDLTYAKEVAAEQEAELRKYKRKRDKLEAKERIEDMVGPKPVGREAQLEKKRVKRENDKEFRERGDDGLEMDESTLLGGGDSFQAMIARRDAAKNRYQSKMSEEAIQLQERANARREKEKATMEMFQQLAKQRFG